MSVDLDKMPVFELARWCSLIEGVNIIADECERRGKKFDDMKIPPLSLERYVEGSCDRMAKEVEKDRESKQKRKKEIALMNTENI